MTTIRISRCVAAIVILALYFGLMPVRAQAAGEAALENKALRIVATPGQGGVAVYIKSDPTHQRVELAIVATGATASEPISAAEVVKSPTGRSVLHVTAGAAEAEFTLGAEGYVKTNPGRNAGSVEVRAGARYAVLPDFFADDVVFDPERFAVPSLTVPAENFLLQFIEGGDTIVMSDWAGTLKQASGASDPTGGVPPKEEKEAAEPQVDLVFSGEGKARRVAAARIEFQNQPVYTGIIEQKGLWQDQDAASLPTYKPTPIDWKRPFEARWRGDFIVAPGKRIADWPTRNQSFDFKSTSNAQSGADPLDARFTAATSSKRSANWWEENGVTWWERGDENAPEIWQESLASFFIYPAVFKGDEVRLCLYADKHKRDQPHVYERVIIYPLGRVAATPLNVFTPIDLMRETLGQGPCEYILDVAGITPRRPGGDRQTLAYATCGLWEYHIEPIVQQIKKKPDGTFEPLDEKTKTHLIQALQDMWYFVHAVHDRLREYKKWGADMDAFCKEESAKSPAVAAIADETLAHLDPLNADIARHKFEGPGSEAYWKDRVPELIKMVQADDYSDVGSISKIRDLGNEQDERVSRCRQYVKAIVQETVFQDTSDPGARGFAAKVRDRCHQMLRNQHPKEGF